MGFWKSQTFGKSLQTFDSNMYFRVFLWIFVCFESVSAKKTPAPPHKEINRQGPMDLKIYSLERNPRL
jgi:hypothetical protein